MRLVVRLLGGQPADDLAELGHPLLQFEFGLGAARGVTEVPQVQHVERRKVVLGWPLEGGLAQVGVDVPGGLLAVPDADRDGALAGHHVASGEHPGQPVISDVETCTVPSSANSTPGDAAQEVGVGLLAQRQDHRVRRERLEPAGAARPAVPRPAP